MKRLIKIKEAIYNFYGLTWTITTISLETLQCLLCKKLNIMIDIVLHEITECLPESILNIQLILYRRLHLLYWFSYIHSDVGHGILLQSDNDGDEHSAHDIGRQDGGECRHAEEGSQSVQVVFIDMQAQELGDYMGHCPLGPKDLCQVFHIVKCCLSNRVDAIT